MRVALIVCAVSFVSTSASAMQCGGSGPELKEPAICSRIFQFQGSCGKAVYPWPDWNSVVFATGAWENTPIRITYVSADAMITARWRPITASIFAGNSFNADPMTPFIYASAPAGFISESVATIHADHDFGNTGMQFPAGLPMLHTHIDVHLLCRPDGAYYHGSLTVIYKIDQPQITQSSSLH